MNTLTLPQYLIESSICLICFYAFYELILKKETHFQFNRFYLLLSALFSISIPFLNFQLSVDGSSNTFNDFVLPVITGAQNSHQTFVTSVEEPSPFIISVGDVIRIIYLLGVFMMSIKFLEALLNVIRMIQVGHKKREGKEIIIDTAGNTPASSFFSYIFWNGDNRESHVGKTIMEHELVHVRQWHSLDVILMELMVILKWFNPLIYLFRRSLRLTHEYIADRYVSGLTDRLTYANVLLTHVPQESRSGLQHTFYSDIRKRVEMLSRGESNGWRCLRILGFVPLLLCLMTLFSFDFTDRIEFVSEGMDSINEKYEDVQSTALLRVNYEEKSDVYSADSVIISDRIHPVYKSMQMDIDQMTIFRWGNLLQVMPSKSQDLENDISMYSFTSRISERPILFTANKYWDSFEFDLVLYFEEVKVYSERIIVDENYDFDNEKLSSHQFDKVWIDNLVVSDFNGKSNISFYKRIDDDTYPRGLRFPYFSKNIVIGDKRMLVMPHKLEGGSPFGQMVNASELVETIMSTKDWKIEEIEESKDFLLEDYNIRIDVIRDIVVDESYNLAQHELPQLIKSEVLQKDPLRGKLVQESIAIFDFDSEYHVQSLKKWVSSMTSGDLLYLTIESKDGDEAQGGVLSFEIAHEHSAFDPAESYYENRKYLGAKMPSKYQIVYRRNQRSLVKVDTENPDNEKIVRAFSDTLKYELMHIPNFSTDYRIIEYKDDFGSSNVKQVKSSPIIDELDVHALPEFVYDEDKMAIFHWGRMISLPKVGNFSIKEFHRSRKQQPYLKIGDEEYKVLRFSLHIKERDKEAVAYQACSVKSFSLNNYLSKLDQELSIYFDDVIIEKDGIWYHLMERYSFVFE